MVAERVAEEDVTLNSIHAIQPHLRFEQSRGNVTGEKAEQTRVEPEGEGDVDWEREE